MTVYTRRLVGQTVAASGATVLYTVPADQLVVVRDVVVFNTNGAQDVQIYASIPGFNPRLMGVLQIQQSTSVHQDLRFALNPGDQLVCYCTLGAITVAITGYVFTEP